MMRADMDALMMTEENADLPYRSASPGLAHMCGHDGHMAALIGAAVLLNSPAVRGKFPSNSAVRLLFQPAEETPGGAGATSPQTVSPPSSHVCGAFVSLSTDFAAGNGGQSR